MSNAPIRGSKWFPSGNNRLNAIPVIALLTYGAFFAASAPLLLQDYPNHLARAMVMADLLYHHGKDFGDQFTYEFLPVPYVEADLGLVALIGAVGMRFATAAWPVFVFLALPAGLFAYLRARGASSQAQCIMLLLGVYLSTDTTFMMGFLSFRLGVGLFLIALALAERLRQNWSRSEYFVFIAVIVLTYLTHLAAIIFIIVALGCSAILRRVLNRLVLQREMYLLGPLIAVLVWHFGVATSFSLPQSSPDPYHWGSVTLKAQNLLWDLARYGLAPSSLVLAGLFFVIPLIYARGSWSPTALRNPRVLEDLLLALTSAVLYIILPDSYSAAGYVDVRTLVLPPLFAMVGIFSLPDAVRKVAQPARGSGLVITLSILLVAGNLGYLRHHLEKDGAQLATYRSVVNDIPLHSRVLPIYTAHSEGVMKPFLHVSEFAVIDRHAFVPYLFSANRGEPMTYFRYLHLPYAPPEEWYVAHPQLFVDWKKVQTEYDYLLVQEPFDLRRLPLQTKVISANAAAALLKILPDGS